MPKVANLYAPADIIQRNIELAAAAKGLRYDSEICKRCGLSAAGYYKKKTKPRTWTIEQLVHAANGLGVSFEWLVTKHDITKI